MLLLQRHRQRLPDFLELIEFRSDGFIGKPFALASLLLG
jgi:hypothetical protein